MQQNTEGRKLVRDARKHLPTHPDGEPHSGIIAELRKALPDAGGVARATAKRSPGGAAEDRAALYAALPQHPDEATSTRKARHG
ncbi:MAG TPA: hypothetical protein VF584_05750 [Longimicrobium sp.]|jgi:hypothetical protein